MREYMKRTISHLCVLQDILIGAGLVSVEELDRLNARKLAQADGIVVELDGSIDIEAVSSDLDRLGVDYPELAKLLNMILG